MGFNLKKREVRDAIKLRHDLAVMIFPPLDYVAIFLQLTTQWYASEVGLLPNVKMSWMIFSDVEIESALQDISGEQLEKGSNRAPGARLHIHSREFWGNQRSAFFEVKVSQDSYRDLYHNHEN